MKRYIPADKLDGVHEKLLNKYDKYICTDPQRAQEYLDAANNLQVHHTTTREIIIADKNPKLYAAYQEGKYVVKEMAVKGAQAAAAGGVVSGAISVVKNSLAVKKGDMTKEQAMKLTLKETGKGALKGGATGVTGSFIRNIGQKAGIGIKQNVAVSLASCLIDTGGAILDYSKGKITGEEAIERIGQNGVSTASSIYTGAAAGAVFGPVGAVIGSIAGYMVSSNVYQSCLTILKSANLAEEEAERVVALCREASEEMRRQRQLFETQAEKQLEIRRTDFAIAFGRIEGALESSNHEESVLALSDFALLFGEKLKLSSFKEFDEHMKASKTLVL